MRFDLFIAKRIYKTKSGNDTFSRPAIVIAIAGIAVGIIIMILSVSIVLGFKKEVSSKVIGFNSHIQILNRSQGLEAEVYPIRTDEILSHIVNKTPYIARYQLFCLKTGLIKTEDDFKGVQIKGIGEDYDMEFYKKYLVQGTIPNFTSKKSSNSIIISQSNAN